MKDIISGKRTHLKIKDVNFIQVPKFAEISCENISNLLQIKDSQKLLNFCPEMENSKYPYDREFFYNIVNTQFPRKLEKMIYNAI